MTSVKLLALSGSLRKDSLNTKLMHEAIRLFGTAEVSIGTLRMPLYDGDLEDATGVPDQVIILANQIAQADAVVLACPEYNQCFPGVVKNALDWISRTDGAPWADKPLAIIHAAAGRTGGARANYALCLALAPFNTRLLQGPEVLVAGAHQAFDDNGRLTNEHYIKSLTSLMQNLRDQT